ncbi:MAG: glycosyl transferase family 2 [Bacteroidales bacterium]|jgi:glycosyltransferase involved in cell wall biosynthesis|nr:glycosyl transferase family 2 [Bacteroidales bacterium]
MNIPWDNWLPLFYFDAWEITVLSVVFLSFCIQVFYYFKPYKRLYAFSKYNCHEYSNENPPAASVIIYTDNDSGGLEISLKSLLMQDYPNFEIIIVCETYDENAHLLSQYKEKYPNVYCTYIPEDSKSLSRKKLALTVAIKASKNDILLFIEPGCKLTSKDWMRKMIRNYIPGIDIVLGYSRIAGKHYFLNHLMAYDNLFSAIQYLGKATSGEPFKGLGRNLSYRKQLFYSSKGFSKYLFLQYGDDDLFINQNATRNNTRVEISPDSIADYAMPPKDWEKSKMRYSLTSKYYSGKTRFFFEIETFSRYLFYICALGILALSFFDFFKWTLAASTGLLFFIRFGIQCFVINKTASVLKERKYRFSLIWFDIVLPFVNMYYAVYRKFGGKKDFTYNFNTKS